MTQITVCVNIFMDCVVMDLINVFVDDASQTRVMVREYCCNWYAIGSAKIVVSMIGHRHKYVTDDLVRWTMDILNVCAVRVRSGDAEHKLSSS